eukprot:4137634-Amphidinium_carterae.1
MGKFQKPQAQRRSTQTAVLNAGLVPKCRDELLLLAAKLEELDGKPIQQGASQASESYVQ